MKQPHTEQSIEHTDDQQNTGNHKQPGAPDAGGADKVGGTRAGAENVEPVDRDSHAESVESGTDVDRVSGLDEVNTSTKQDDGSRERHPERDEHGRM
jgi:hypothetical protein